MLAAAFGIAVIVSLAWGAVGWTGTVLKSAAVAIAVMLLWTTIVQVQVDYYATMMPKLRMHLRPADRRRHQHRRGVVRQVNYGGRGRRR